MNGADFMTLTKICKDIERKTGIKGAYKIGVHDLHYVEYNCENHHEYSAIMNAVNLKYTKIWWNSFTTGLIRLCERSEYDVWQEWNLAKENLVEGFWQAYHIGGQAAADAYYAENLDKYREYGIVGNWE